MQSIWQRFAILLRQKKEGMYTKLDCVCVKLTLESRISHHTIIPHLTNPYQFLRLIGASFPQKESSPRFYGTFPLLGRMGG